MGPFLPFHLIKVKMILLLLLLLPVFAWADTPGSSTTEERIPLTVRDCIVKALENNLDISIQRITPQLDDAAILQARGEFDPAFTLSPSYGEATSSLDRLSSNPASPLSRTTTWKTALEGKVPSSTSYSLSFDTTDSQTAANTFRDQYSSGWGLTLTQPLLKGFGTDNQLSSIRIKRKAKEISNEDFSLKVMDVVTQIKSAYYNLFFAIEDQKVKLQALELNAKTLADDRKRVEIGVKTPLDVTQDESAVAQGEVALITANQNININMNNLRKLISRDISELRKQRLWPVDSPSDVPPPLPNLEEVIGHAIETRPDYLAAKLAVEKQHLQLKFAENQKYPQIDLTGTYGYNGISREFIQSVNTEADTWVVGLSIKIPFPDQANQGKLKAATLEKEKSLLFLKQTEQKILVEVDNALEKVQSNYKNIGATRAARRAAQGALDAETAKMKAGTATTFILLELQKKLADAKSSEIQATVNYNIAIAELQQAEGSTLRVNDIELVK